MRSQLSYSSPRGPGSFFVQILLLPSMGIGRSPLSHQLDQLLLLEKKQSVSFSRDMFCLDLLWLIKIDRGALHSSSVRKKRSKFGMFWKFNKKKMIFDFGIGECAL